MTAQEKQTILDMRNKGKSYADHNQVPGFLRAVHEQGTGQRLSKARSPQSPE